MGYCWAAAVLIIFVVEINSAPQSYHKVSHQKHEEKTEEVYSSGLSSHGTHSPLIQPVHDSNLGLYDIHSAGNSMYDQQKKIYGTSFSSSHNNFQTKIQPPDNLAFSSYYTSHSPSSSSFLIKPEPFVNTYQTSGSHEMKHLQEKEINFNNNNKFAETITNQQLGVSNDADYKNKQKLMKLVVASEIAPPSTNTRGDMFSLNNGDTFRDSGLDVDRKIESYQVVKKLPTTHFTQQANSEFNTHQIAVSDTSDSIHQSRPKVTSTYLIQPQVHESNIQGTNLGSGDKQFGYVASTREESYRNSNGDGWTKRTHEFQPLANSHDTNGLLKQYSNIQTIGSQTHLENDKNTNFFVTPGFIQSESKPLPLEATPPNFSTVHQLTPVQDLQTFDHIVKPLQSSWSSWSSWSAWSTGPQEHKIESRQRIESAVLKKYEPISDSSKTEAEKLYTSTAHQNSEKQVVNLDGSATNNYKLLSINNPVNTKDSSSHSSQISGSYIPQQIHPVIANKQIESASLTRDDAFIQSQKQIPFVTEVGNKDETNVRHDYNQNTKAEIPEVFPKTVLQPAVKSVKKSKTQHEEYVQLSYNSQKPEGNGFIASGNPDETTSEITEQHTKVASEALEPQTNSQHSHINYVYQKQIAPTNLQTAEGRPTPNFNDAHEMHLRQSQAFTINTKQTEKGMENILPPQTENTFIDQERGPEFDILHNINREHVLNEHKQISHPQTNQGKKYSSTTIKKETHNSTEITESHSEDYGNEKGSKSSETIYPVLTGTGNNPRSENYKFHEQEYLQSQFGPQKNLERIEQTNVHSVLDDGSLDRRTYQQLVKTGNSFNKYQNLGGINDERILTSVEQNHGNLESLGKLSMKHQESDMKQKLEEMRIHMLAEMRKKQEFQTPVSIESSQNFGHQGNTLKTKTKQSEHYSEKHSSQTFTNPSVYFQTQPISLYQGSEPCPYGTELDTDNKNKNSMNSFERQRFLDSDDYMKQIRHKRYTPFSFSSDEGKHRLNEYKKYENQAADFLGQEIGAQLDENAPFYSQEANNQQLQLSPGLHFDSQKQNSLNDFARQLEDNLEQQPQKLQQEFEQEFDGNQQNSFTGLGQQTQSSYGRQQPQRLQHDFESAFKGNQQNSFNGLGQQTQESFGQQQPQQLQQDFGVEFDANQQNSFSDLGQQTQNIFGQQQQLQDILESGFNINQENSFSGLGQQTQENFGQQQSQRLQQDSELEFDGYQQNSYTGLEQQTQNSFRQQQQQQQQQNPQQSQLNLEAQFDTNQKNSFDHPEQQTNDNSEQQYGNYQFSAEKKEDDQKQKTQQTQNSTKTEYTEEEYKELLKQINEVVNEMYAKNKPIEYLLTFLDNIKHENQEISQNPNNQEQQITNQITTPKFQENDFSQQVSTTTLPSQERNESQTARIFDLGQDWPLKNQTKTDFSQQTNSNSESGQQNSQPQKLTETEQQLTNQQGIDESAFEIGAQEIQSPQQIFNEGQQLTQTGKGFSPQTTTWFESGQQNPQKLTELGQQQTNQQGIDESEFEIGAQEIQSPQQIFIEGQQLTQTGNGFGPQTTGQQNQQKLTETEQLTNQQGIDESAFETGAQEIQSPQQIFNEEQQLTQTGNGFSPQTTAWFESGQQNPQKLTEMGRQQQTNQQSIDESEFEIGAQEIQSPQQIFNEDQQLTQTDKDFGQHTNDKIQLESQVPDHESTQKIINKQHDDEFGQQQNTDNEFQLQPKLTDLGQQTTDDFLKTELGQQARDSFQRTDNAVTDTAEQSTSEQDKYSNVFDEVNENDNTEQEQNNQTVSGNNSSQDNKPVNKTTSFFHTPKFSEEEYKKIIQKFETIFDLKSALNSIKQKLGQGSTEPIQKNENKEENEAKEKSNTNETNNSKENSNESHSKESDRNNNNSNNNNDSHENQSKESNETPSTSIWGRFRNRVTDTYTSARDKVKEVAGKVKETLN